MMKDYLDEKEKRYVEYLGEPVLVAHDVIAKPHVDVYVFRDKISSIFLYLTKGMEEVGYRELLMTTDKQEKWPVFFLNAVVAYQIEEKKPIKEMETYDNVKPIKDCADVKAALFTGIDSAGFNKDEFKKKLGLKELPIYVLQISDKELKYSLSNSPQALLNRIKSKQ